MKSTVLSLALTLVCGGAIAAETKIATTSGISVSGAIVWSVNPDNGELNLLPAKGGGTPFKLCDTVSTANLTVHFSPDDKFVAVADGTGSLGIHVTLYKRGTGLNFDEVDFDFDLASERMAFEAQTGKPINDAVLDHSYLKCLGWSRDGQWLLLQLSGSGKRNGKRVEVSGFKCAYHPVRQEMTDDPRVMK